MRNPIILIALGLLMMACEGKQGPVGPQGPVGEEGPSGAPILYFRGSISAQDYEGPYIRIDHYIIEDRDVIQVYLSPDEERYTWLFMPYFELTDGIVYIYDPDQDFLHWDFMLMIIKDSND